MLFRVMALSREMMWNPLRDERVNNATMNTLMYELKILQQETLAWKKPQAGEPCNHMHVECWDGKFMCLGCSPAQEITDPERIRTEREIMQKLGDEDLSVPEQSVERGVTIAFLVALCHTFNLYEVTTGDVLRDFIIYSVDERIAMSICGVECDAEVRRSWYSCDLHNPLQQIFLR